MGICWHSPWENWKQAQKEIFILKCQLEIGHLHFCPPIAGIVFLLRCFEKRLCFGGRRGWLILLIHRKIWSLTTSEHLKMFWALCNTAYILISGCYKLHRSSQQILSILCSVIMCLPAQGIASLAHCTNAHQGCTLVTATSIALPRFSNSSLRKSPGKSGTEKPRERSCCQCQAQSVVQQVPTEKWSFLPKS